MREKQARKSVAERVFVEAKVRVRECERVVGFGSDDPAATDPASRVGGREGRSWDW